MTTYETIQARIKGAMISGDTTTRDCLRTIVSEIKNQTINANPPVEITDEVCLKALRKSAKTHGDSIAQFETAGRAELLDKEKAELAVIESLLPKTLSDEETVVLINGIVAESGLEKTKKNFGQFMKALSASPNASQVDRKVASRILQGMLI